MATSVDLHLGRRMCKQVGNERRKELVIVTESPILPRDLVVCNESQMFFLCVCVYPGLMRRRKPGNHFSEAKREKEARRDDDYPGRRKSPVSAVEFSQTFFSLFS